MNIAFRVDSSIQIGIGHIMRCLTLAEFLKAKGANIFFICRKHKGNIIHKIKDAGFFVFELEHHFSEKKLKSEILYSSWLGSTPNEDAEECINLLKNIRIEWLIIDHYSLNEDWHRKLKKYCKKLMVIDDMADKHFYCHLLVNQNLGINKEAYIKKLPFNCKLLIGTEFTILRNEFVNLREQALKKRSRTREIKNILISLGGVDPQNITLNVLRKIGNKNLNITVVLGYESPHINTIKKQTGISLNLWGINPLEVTHFKAGFLGIKPDFEEERVYSSGALKQLRYQKKRFMAMCKSPNYFNSSLWDTLSGEYYRSFAKKEDYYHVFDYWRWDENIVNDTLLQKYDWEIAIDTKTTWRIGDGTAAFYNYIYRTVAGFTEHDTFRSNQIREGDLTREEAIELIEDENRPRYENIRWYLDTLNMDFNDVIKIINSIPKLHKQ